MTSQCVTDTVHMKIFDGAFRCGPLGSYDVGDKNNLKMVLELEKNSKCKFHAVSWTYCPMSADVRNCNRNTEHLMMQFWEQQNKNIFCQVQCIIFTTEFKRFKRFSLPGLNI